MSNCPHCGAALADGSQFCTACGKPLTQTSAPTPKKKSSGCLVVAIVLVVIGIALLVILAAGGFLVYKYRGKLSVATTEASSSSSSSDAPAAAEAGPVKVTLSCDQPVDMDLEIWDEPGKKMIARSFAYCGKDVVDMTQDQEYFVFDRYDTRDFSTGEYVVSIFFNARKDTSIKEAKVRIEVKRSDGGVVTRERTILWEKGHDQWHAFRIDAATGRIEDIDDFISTKTTPARRTQ